MANITNNKFTKSIIGVNNTVDNVKNINIDITATTVGFDLPASIDTAGKVLTSNGVNAIWGAPTTFTGGTVTGSTSFTGGLTATTISATTYQGLPIDIRVTGGTYNTTGGTATFTNNTGGTFSVSGFSTGGGLVYFKEYQNTAAPNTTTYVNAFSAISTTTNADFAIIPKGTGAIVASVPDNTTVGGNKRGSGSVDLQIYRNAANQVASGGYSFAAGSRNRVSGEYASAIGQDNVSTANYSIALGYNNTASNTGTVSLGWQNTVSGAYSYAIGFTNTVAGQNSAAIGYLNSASATASYAFGSSCLASNQNAIAMGNRAKATGEAAICLASYFYSDSTASGMNSTLVGCGNVAGTFALGLGFQVTTGGAQATAIGFNANTFTTNGRVAIGAVAASTGTAQKGIISYRQLTTDATPTILTTNNQVAFADTNAAQFALQNQQVVRFKGSITAKKSGTTDVAIWDIDGVLVRGANAASTVLTVGNVTFVTNAPGWPAPVLAANTSVNVGGLKITVTGAAATSIQWFCTIDTVENIYA